MRVGAARPWRGALALGGAILAADQASKALIEANLFPGERLHVLGPLYLTEAHNRGVAFGLADGGGAALTAITLAALAFVLVLFARDPLRPGMWVGVGLLGGGAIGNLVDRVRMGAVTDFIDLPAWPPFNLADVAITVGVALLALAYLQRR